MVYHWSIMCMILQICPQFAGPVAVLRPREAKSTKASLFRWQAGSHLGKARRSYRGSAAWIKLDHGMKWSRHVNLKNRPRAQDKMLSENSVLLYPLLSSCARILVPASICWLTNINSHLDRSAIHFSDTPIPSHGGQVILHQDLQSGRMSSIRTRPGSNLEALLLSYPKPCLNIFKHVKSSREIHTCSSSSTNKCHVGVCHLFRHAQIFWIFLDDIW